MELNDRFKDYIASEKLFDANDDLLLAVSGGVDSVVLCRLCHQSGFNFSIAHCNFQLRGKDSDSDEAFVQGLASEYGVGIFVKRFDTKSYASGNGLSIQQAARDLRYEWFAELLGHHARPGRRMLLLTAHHADDNIETVLMNFFRGTGIRGLKGIDPKHRQIIRPLLFARKREIEQFAKDQHLEFVTDISNLEDNYTRNYFRNQLIPSVEKVFTNVNENILANIERFRDAIEIYQQAIVNIRKDLVEIHGNELHVPVLKLKKQAPLNTIIYEITRDYGFSAAQADEVAALLNSGPGKYVQSSTHRIIRDRRWLIITTLESKQSESVLIEGTGNWELAIGRLCIEELSGPGVTMDGNNSKALFDSRMVSYPLLFRKWKQGDYFYPLGMRKKKKLSRFFIDQKLSKTEKENVWVLETAGRIAWVINYRIDDRFKVTGNTRSVTQMQLVRRGSGPET